MDLYIYGYNCRSNIESIFRVIQILELYKYDKIWNNEFIQTQPSEL